MKYIILLITIQLVIQNIYCNDDLLAKEKLIQQIEFQFHQNGYKIRDIRASSSSFDKNYFNYHEVRSFKYNRTTTAINFTLNAKVEFQDKLEILVQGYKFLSNEYRRIPMRFQVNLKKAFEANIIGLAGFTKCGNMTTFYFLKNVTYHACNFVLDETRFPPLVPSGKYKMETTHLYLDIPISVVNIFGEVYTPVKYPKDK